MGCRFAFFLSLADRLDTGDRCELARAAPFRVSGEREIFIYQLRFGEKEGYFPRVFFSLHKVCGTYSEVVCFSMCVDEKEKYVFLTRDSQAQRPTQPTR